MKHEIDTFFNEDDNVWVAVRNMYELEMVDGKLEDNDPTGYGDTELDAIENLIEQLGELDE